MKLKRFIELFIFFFFFGIVTCQSQASIPKVEKIYKNIPELIIKDSLFLCGIDSLIFKSFCPEIKRKVFKTFNIISQKRDGYFSLIFSLCPQFEYYERVALKGYFKYKDYIFIWYGDIPQYLGDVSNKEKKIPYVSQPSYMRTETTEFYFNYTFKKLSLTGLCCMQHYIRK